MARVIICRYFCVGDSGGIFEEIFGEIFGEFFGGLGAGKVNALYILKRKTTNVIFHRTTNTLFVHNNYY